MSQNPFDAFDAAYKASLNNAYRDAKLIDQQGYMLPEGKYQCIISAFSLKPSTKFPDELNLSLGFEIIQGDQKGMTAYKYYQIVPENLDRLKTDMNTLGINLEDDITKLGELQTADKILDQIVDISIKHKRRDDGKGFYQNVYLNRSHGKAGDSFQETDDDENPFE